MKHRTVGKAIALSTLALLLLAPTSKCLAEQPSGKPIFKDHVLYAPAHFGNSYEVMGRYEMQQLIAEAKHWGFNRYADWFDTVDCSDPFAKHGHAHVQLAEALWARKLANFASAQALGLKCDLVITPNHVFIDQCLPGRLAKQGGRVFGQLVCPSVAEGRAMILKNYENMFADMARKGIRLSAICPCPYDYGGCLCDQCQPWIITFAKLCREIHAVCKKYHPDVKMHMIGWWWKVEEHEKFADWVDTNAPGWVERIYMHIPYGTTTVSSVRLPKGCERAAFVHIGYADQATPRDVYGHLGPVIAAVRLPKTVHSLADQHVSSVMAYSEGVFDDVNKSLLAGIGSGQFADADQVLRSYAKRYFLGDSDDSDDAAEWAKWLRQWGIPYQVNTVAAIEQWKSLAPAVMPDNWRLRQWNYKMRMLDLNQQIGTGKTWTPERLALVDRLWKTREQLHSRVWGLGPVRHVLNIRFTSFPWYGEWTRYQAATQESQLGSPASEKE